ncbi:MAG: hypothetical protein ACRDJO_11050 [Actinomycetota bacterium]
MGRVGDFFGRYEAAVRTGDGRRIRPLFHDCFAAASPAGAFCGENNDALASVIEKGLAFYRGLGITDLQVLAVDERWLGPANCMATVHWRAVVAGRDPMEFDVSYLLHDRASDGLVIFGWVSHEDEMEAFRARGMLPDEQPGVSPPA